MKLISIKQAITAGKTIPHLVSLEDNNNYILKFPGNPEKTNALVSEYVCHELASILKLPVIPKKIATINFDALEDVYLLSDEIDKINGFGFATLYNKTANVVNDPSLFQISKNYFDFIPIYIFDILIGNFDRNKGNLLFDTKLNKLLLIDHTHAFGIGPIFSSLELKRRTKIPFTKETLMIHPYSQNLYEEYKNTNNFRSLKQRERFSDFVNLVKLITKNDILSIVKRAQEIWQIDDEVVLSLTDYLYDRFNRIDEIILFLNLEVD